MPTCITCVPGILTVALEGLPSGLTNWASTPVRALAFEYQAMTLRPLVSVAKFGS